MAGFLLRASLVLLLLGFLPPTSHAGDGPNVILITLDTVRADRMGFLGSTRGLTPQMDALARQSVVFERAYAQAPLTPVAHASILTGTYPQFHKVEDFGQRLGANLPYLPDLLRVNGYRTAAFVSSIILDPVNGFATGFERGFDTYDAGFQRRRKGQSRYATVQRRGHDTVTRAIDWLDHNADASFFLWVHLWDAHDPYDPPTPYAKRFPNAPYDGAIAYVDAEVGRLIAALRAKKVFANGVIVVVSDHGEGLGQHGENRHGILLYDETIQVPLMVKLPEGRLGGQRAATRVGQVDVAPTILEAAGVPVPQAMQGQSALRLIGSKSAADRASYAETQYSRRAFGWSALTAVRTEKYLYVKAPQEELYDLAADPAAANNLAAKDTATTARIREELNAFLGRSAGSSKESGQEGLDPETAQKLASLGYVASGGRRAGSGTIDPKTRIQVANAVHDANLAIEENKPEAAIPLLERVVRSDPQIQSAQYFLGMAHARLKNYAKAIPPLRKAIELQPDAVMAHYEMGLALFETGDWKTAATHFEIVVQRNPTWADARFSLASVQARIDRVPESMANLLLVLDQNAQHYRANLLLGRLLTLKGQADAATPYLEKAVQVQPDSAEAHAFLADSFAKLGRAEDAQRERDKAAELRATPRPRPLR